MCNNVYFKLLLHTLLQPYAKGRPQPVTTSPCPVNVITMFTLP